MNNINRRNEKQNGYQDWELRVLLAVNSRGVTAENLTHVIKRSVISIRRKACDIGVSLKGDVKCTSK